MQRATAMRSASMRSVIARVGRRHMSSIPSWATADPATMSAATPAIGKNLCGGEWTEARPQHAAVDPMNGEAFVLVPDTQADEIGPFVQRLRECPRSGLHNPLKNVERYNMLGDVMAKGSRELAKPEVNAYFAELIRRVVPKSKTQCVGEPTITRKWMENYCCDQARAQRGVIRRNSARASLTRVCRGATRCATSRARSPSRATTPASRRRACACRSAASA